MDDLYLDGALVCFFDLFVCLYALCIALGIADEVDRLGLKGSKKKRSKKLDEDWMVLVADVPSVRVQSAEIRTYSLYSSPWHSKRYRRSFRPCGRLRVARSSSNCLRESRLVFSGFIACRSH